MTAIDIVSFCCVALILVVLLDSLRTRYFAPVLWQVPLLMAVILFAFYYYRFAGGRIEFGNDQSRAFTVAVIFIASLLGAVANYFFELKSIRFFNWLSLSKPLLITPIIMLPLVGSIQQRSNIEITQILMFGLLAFQNGFFWRAVFLKAQKRAGS